MNNPLSVVIGAGGTGGHIYPVLALAEALRRRVPHAVVNLGTGEEIAVGDLARKLIAVTGRDAEVVVDASRLRPTGSEIHRLLSDNFRARTWASWKPKVSLDEGLRRTSDWIGTNLHLFAPGRNAV